MPILIYSYPGVTAGMDLSAELISDLAEHPNIRGIKHTDHDISKVRAHAPTAATLTCDCRVRLATDGQFGG